MASDAERTCGWCDHFACLTDDERRGICLLEMRDALGTGLPAAVAGVISGEVE